MPKIQTNKCLQCSQTKAGLSFENSETGKREKFYCWECLIYFMEKELEDCADWERNKKKLFKERIKKCQKRESFEWPWRENFVQGSTIGWDRSHIWCVQCTVSLHWDVSPYGDSKHICSYCSNCNQLVNLGTIDEHFYWQETTPIYKCAKSVTDESYWKENCMYCDSCKNQANKTLKEEVVDLGGRTFSTTSYRPNAKAHCAVSTKRHADDIRKITLQEWDDILPVLKDTIRKIMKIYRPVGFYIGIPTGRLGGQNQSHFYMRVVPKYKKGYGSIAIKEHFIPATLEELQEVHQKLQDNNGVVGERSKVVAELDNIYYGRVLIKPKKPIANTIDNFVNLDPEIWSQIGQLLQEHVKSQEIKLGAEGFGIGIDVGKWGDVDETTGPWLKLSMRPRIKHNRGHQWGGRAGRPLGKDGKPMGSMETERIAEKLRDPEDYYEKWKGDKDYLKHKRERERQELKGSSNLWKQPYLYLAFASGVGICLLGVVIYWLGKRIKKIDSVK
jgi:diadenosine tetraphosphate (Ap4A) HIT family hydrolase